MRENRKLGLQLIVGRVLKAGSRNMVFWGGNKRRMTYAKTSNERIRDIAPGPEYITPATPNFPSTIGWSESHTLRHIPQH